MAQLLKAHNISTGFPQVHACEDSQTGVCSAGQLNQMARVVSASRLLFRSVRISGITFCGRVAQRGPHGSIQPLPVAGYHLGALVSAPVFHSRHRWTEKEECCCNLLAELFAWLDRSGEGWRFNLCSCEGPSNRARNRQRAFARLGSLCRL